MVEFPPTAPGGSSHRYQTIGNGLNWTNELGLWIKSVPNGGVILSTGQIEVAKGPNNDTRALWEKPNDTAGDTDLDSLVSGLVTYDAAVLEFNVVSTTTTNLVLEYVFASDEYSEYVGTINDIMGIFVTPESGPKQNVALVPGTTDPVSVSKINNGNDGSIFPPSDPVNEQYFVNNEPPTLNIQYDGLTTVLTAEIELLADVTYRIKIAIADANDRRIDSAVFIKATVPCP